MCVCIGVAFNPAVVKIFRGRPVGFADCECEAQAGFKREAVSEIELQGKAYARNQFIIKRSNRCSDISCLGIDWAVVYESKQESCNRAVAEVVRPFSSYSKVSIARVLFILEPVDIHGLECKIELRDEIKTQIAVISKNACRQCDKNQHDCNDFLHFSLSSAD